MASSKLKTDSPLSHRIVRSFVDFLNSVEPAPGVDLEGLEVAKECLTEVFKLDSPAVDGQTNRDSLIDIFHSLESGDHPTTKADSSHRATAIDGPSSSSTHNVMDEKLSQASKSLGEDWTTKSSDTGISKDELFGQFFAALEKIHFFKTMPDGKDDPIQLDKASSVFREALNEMEKSGSRAYNQKNLAEAFKCQGNRAMQSKLYSDAIELYNFAIALGESNAVYYCNRAAAYTQIHKYTEAVGDCLKSIEIDPNYSKAYSRLGLAYYAQGNYSDAIEKGFKKALQLDPNNEAVKENIRVAEQKLREEGQRTGQHQNASSNSSRNTQEPNQSDQAAGGFTTHGTAQSFSMPINFSGLPTDISSMLTNMAANMYPGQPFQNRQGPDGNPSESEDPGIRIGSNINMNFGEQMPEELSGALRSLMEMFPGAPSRGNPQDRDNVNGRSTAN